MKKLTSSIQLLLQEGTVIPAHPLALDSSRQIDEMRQRRLTRYYMAAGAGGSAVGVHSTQFEIRDPNINLYETVLRWASEEMDAAALDRPFIRIAGLCGDTEQALHEVDIALKYGYDIGLLSMGGLNHWSEQQLLERTRAVASRMPVFGFYLQPAVGGRVFSFEFWEQFAAIDNVVAMKCASFDRYQTLDVMRAVAHSPRRNEITMYTGNDDNIVADLLTPYRFLVHGEYVDISFKGGLLGHWGVWTKKAVELLAEIKRCRIEGDYSGMLDLLARGVHITDVNAAIFDPANHFHGCIPGIHEMLRRQGLLAGRWCLNPAEELSVGQAEEIDRVCRAYPFLDDTDFVKEFLKNEGNVSL